MRNTALVGVIFCLALSSALATGVVEAFLEKAAETPFGRTLIETIELELQSAAPGDRFFKMLGQMKSAQEADLKSLAETNTRTQGKCKQDLALLKREIKNSARIVVDSKKQVKKDSRHRAWAENQKESNQRQLAEASTNYNKIKDLRKAEINDYTKKINEINEALKVLHEGKNLIENNLKAPAFVQVANVFNSYVEKMTREIVSQEYKGRGYVSVVSYIGELLQKAKVQANQGSVQKIRKAIQDIIDQLENTKTFENNAERERKSNFVQLKNIYKKSIGELRESIQKFTTIIDQLKKNIKSSMSNVRLHTKNIRVKGRQKRKRTRECQTALNLFNKENKRRQTQLSIVVEAIKLIEDNKDEFRKIVLSNAKAAIDSRYGKK